jgi:hypothetical protein
LNAASVHAARAVVPHVQAAAVRTTATSRINNQIAARQFHTAYATQFRAAQTGLQQALSAQVAQLYANGQPTAQQLADFNAFASGAIDATAFRLASQYALLPGSSRALVPGIQNALLSSQRNSLLSQIQALTNSSRFTGSQTALQNAINRQLNATFNTSHAQLANFFNTTNFNRLSVDQNGQPIPLQQYLGNQVINQFSNTLGSFAQSFPNVANSVLFPNGATTATTAAQQAFANQVNQALGTAAFQLGNNLALFPNASTLTPQLQSALFATGTNSNSLLAALQGLPTTNTGFNTAATTAFTNNFSGLISPLNSFFGLTGQPTATLPTGPFTNVFGSSFTGNNVFNGFNGGFGSGFLGFGTAPTGFNTNFGNGFFGMIGTGNTGLGFTVPGFGNGSFGTGTLGTGGLTTFPGGTGGQTTFPGGTGGLITFPGGIGGSNGTVTLGSGTTGTMSGGFFA